MALDSQLTKASTMCSRGGKFGGLGFTGVNHAWSGLEQVTYKGLHGCGSKFNRRVYAGFGPCFHLPEFHFGTGFLSHTHMIEMGYFKHRLCHDSECGRGGEAGAKVLKQSLHKAEQPNNLAALQSPFAPAMLPVRHDSAHAHRILVWPWHPDPRDPNTNRY